MESGGVPKIQVFRPTWDEFKDFNNYILHIEKCGAHKAGLAKVIPPPEWKPRADGYDMDVIGEIEIPAPISQVVNGKQGVYQQFNIQKPSMKVKELRRLAESSKQATPAHDNYEDLERKYWRNISYFPPIYGADVCGSLTDPTVKEWNINKLGSILDFVNQDYGICIDGVNTAYLYFGMWKSSFAWHTEDMDLYSINYLHFGEPKSWYSIPPEHGARLERLANSFFPANFKECPAYLRHKMSVISPMVLKNHSIPVNKIVQEAGEFMITFPYGYHAGYNHGFNCAESTNFASPRWVEYGKRTTQCACRPDMVKISMDTFVKRFQPDRYDLWIQGKDIGPHPEMPGRNSAAPHPSREEILCNKNNPDVPEIYIEPVKKKAKRHLIHKQLETEHPIKEELADCEEEFEIMKDILYKAGEMESDGLDDSDDCKRKPKKQSGDESFEVDVPQEWDECKLKNKSKKVISKRPKSREGEMKHRRIKPEAKVPLPKTILNAPLSKQLQGFRIPKKAANDAPVDPDNWMAEAEVNATLLLANMKQEKDWNSVKVEAAGWHPEISPTPKILKPIIPVDERRSRKQKCPRSNRGGVDSRDVSANIAAMWLQQKDWTLAHEAEFNLLTSQQEPHCSVCSLLRSGDSKWQQQQPNCSPVQLPEELFGGNREPVKVNSKLVRCSSCRVCVHARCYGVAESVGINWLCKRCERSDETAKCCVCLQRGGALKPTTDGRWSHILCAVCFADVSFGQPALREPVVVGSQLGRDVALISCVFCSGRNGFYRGVCLPCSPPTGKSCGRVFHPTCGLVNGVQFSIGPAVSATCCSRPAPKKKPTQLALPLPVGQQVYAKHPLGGYHLAEVMDNSVVVTYYCVDFEDGTSSRDTFPEDIRNYNCKEDGPPPLGAAVDVQWTDGKHWPAHYRGQTQRQVYELRFSDETTVMAERKEIYHPDDGLPKKVRDYIDKQTIARPPS